MRAKCLLLLTDATAYPLHHIKKHCTLLFIECNAFCIPKLSYNKPANPLFRSEFAGLFWYRKMLVTW